MMDGFEVPKKRARPSSRAPAASQYQEPIVISSDESDDGAPAAKRQKSTPPVTNGSYSSALLQRPAKPATSASPPASSESATPDGSKPESRASSLFKQEVAHKKSSPFKAFPAWSVQAAKQRAVQSPDTSSNNTKGPSSQPAASRDQRPDPKARLSTPSDVRSSAAPAVKSRPSTPSTLADAQPSTPSRSTMRDPHFDPLQAESKSTKSESKKSSSHDMLSEDEGLEILKNFQKPVPATSGSNGIANKPLPGAKPKTQMPNFQLAVPIRPTPSPAKSQKPSSHPPPSSQNFSLEIPLDKAGAKLTSTFQAEKNAMFKELEKSTDVAKQRLQDVEKYFGQTGFSKAFSTNDEIERRSRAAPIYKRKADPNKKIELDFGDLSLSDDDEETKERKRNMTDEEAAGPMPEERLKVIMDRLFADHPDPPLTFRNDINDRRIHGKFQFMDQYVIRDGVKTAPPTNNRGCNCAGQCIPSECACLLREVPVDPFDPSNKATVKQTIRTYFQHPDDPTITVLRPEYIANELEPSNQHYEITECNELCGCNSSCWNRVVGRGRTLSLEIYMTERCGFGVRCPGKDILKGQFIDLYLGEVITQDEVEIREHAKHPEAPSYVYTLDWFAKANCYHVDGEYFGSPMRFVNHSCSPNARSFTVQTHQGDKHVYHLAFFAIRDIPAGEQITIDYCPQDALPEKKEEEEEQEQETKDVTMSGSDAQTGDYEDATDTTSSNSSSSSNSNSSSSTKGSSTTTAKTKTKTKTTNARPAAVELPPGPVVVVVEEEEGRSRCYCGSSNCRVWLWREPGRKRKRRTIKTN